MEIANENKHYHLISLLTQCAGDQNVFKRLKVCEATCSALPIPIQKKMKAKEFRTYLQERYLHNKDFISKLKLQTTMESNIETAIELHGVDYDSHPEFNFDEEFNEKLEELDSLLSDFIGKCMLELSKGEEVVF